MPGPLEGLTIVEFAGIGPAPFAAMMLADHGARLIRVDRPGQGLIAGDPLRRSRQSIALDLKTGAGRDVAVRLAARADALIEGFRPGVMERLGLGPDALLSRNPALVYGRVTGWGQDGPLHLQAGHDIDFLALSGLLSVVGPPERPVVPANLIADFAGGGMMLAFGMVSALLAVQRGGGGQVVDAAMAEGAALIGALLFGLRANGLWSLERESNALDGGQPSYGVYRCADGRFLALGALEPQFRAALFAALDLDPGADRQTIAGRIAQRSRAEWDSRLAGTDACAAPVLDLDEAPGHPHHRARGAFIDLDGVVQPGPAPRYGTSRCDPPRPPRQPGQDREEVLDWLGIGREEGDRLARKGAFG